mmetsp:Transcript_62135/g.189725  ORF Transcript_62135/g.189725 Transcript_62135/m.189725 type:complete len:422 (-) Transcript_62135:102-1367(-)
MDEIDRRLLREGGQTGDVQISLMWKTTDDLDLHVIPPSGERIFYENRSSRCGGKLDVDMNAHTVSEEPVENVFWPLGCAPDGTFSVSVNLYTRRTQTPLIDFLVVVRKSGLRTEHRGAIGLGDTTVQVTKFEVAKLFSMEPRTVFGGCFTLAAQAQGVAKQRRFTRFVDTLMASLGATRLAGVTEEQMAELGRLRKMLKRADDRANFAGERANASRLISAALRRLEWSDTGLRDVCGALDAGSDASRPTLVSLTFSKKVTSRRQWFEDLARAVAAPMGVEVAANRADGCFGRTGHNGVALCGTPAASIVAAVIAARIAQAALHACNKTDSDTFCGNFCKQVWPQDTSDADARRAQLAASKGWLRRIFGSHKDGAEWNTPKKYRGNTPTALSGRTEGRKRKAEFEDAETAATKHHMKALAYF